jgi:hypothetical protein
MNEKTEYIGDLTCLTLRRAHETPAGKLKLVSYFNDDPCNA